MHLCAYLQLRFRFLASDRGRWTSGPLGIISCILSRAHRRRQGVPGAGEIRHVQASPGGVLRSHGGSISGSMGSRSARWTHMVRAAGGGCEARSERADATGTWTAADAARMTTGAVRATAAGTTTATATAMVSVLILLALLLG